MLTKDDYDAAFEVERIREYPKVDAYEYRSAIAINRAMLENAARTLACPIKVNPPCWQHGRVLFSAAYNYLSRQTEPVFMLDIGTAKGFSSLCLQWAAEFSGHKDARIVSLDVIDPAAKVKRNTVAEVDGFRTLYETLSPWPQFKAIKYVHSTGLGWLTSTNERRINVAFVDGKHTFDAVLAEGTAISRLQVKGDVVVFDDVQIAGVQNAVYHLSLMTYSVEYIDILPNRRIAVGYRR
jgi:cephalosporin hydroxylase